MSFSTTRRSGHRGRSFTTVSGAAFAVGGAMLMMGTTASLSGAIFKNGFVDHSICCGTGGPLSFDGTPLRGSGASPTTLAAGTVSLGTAGSSAAGNAGSAAKSLQSVNTEATTSAPAAPTTPPKEVDGHVQLEFARLSDFKIEAPASYDPDVKPEASLAAVDKQIPAAIKQFDGKRAQLTGFMLPVKMEGQLVSQFLLLRDQMMCCYGVVPRMNDWIVVYAAKPVRFTPDVAVSFRGKLQVKAMQEQGFITGIYLLEEATPVKL
jgi:hypothetical protein